MSRHGFSFVCLTFGLSIFVDVAAQTSERSANPSPQLPPNYQALPSNVLGASEPISTSEPVPGTRTAGLDLSYKHEHWLRYPQKAVHDRHEGTTHATVLLDEKGAVIGVRLDKSSGDANLDATAIRGVTSWKYVTCYVEYAPRVCWARIPVTFNLNGPIGGN